MHKIRRRLKERKYYFEIDREGLSAFVVSDHALSSDEIQNLEMRLTLLLEQREGDENYMREGGD